LFQKKWQLGRVSRNRKYSRCPSRASLERRLLAVPPSAANGGSSGVFMTVSAILNDGVD
jgi:hypothetical protein